MFVGEGTVSAYSEKLRHPKWQQKRLRILERDGFKCRHCNSADRPLHAHHIQYEHGREPWEYPDTMLVTYCEDCHSKWHQFKKSYPCPIEFTFSLFGFNESHAFSIADLAIQAAEPYGADGPPALVNDTTFPVLRDLIGLFLAASEIQGNDQAKIADVVAGAIREKYAQS